MIQEKRTLKGIDTSRVLISLQAMIREHGFRNSNADWADNDHAYAFSYEIDGLGTFSGPMATAHYSRATGWVSVSY